MIYTEKPTGADSEMSVVAGFLFCEGRFLLLQRQPQKEHGGKWGLPAGKVETRETMEEALCREIFEETGLRISHKDIVRHQSVWVRHDLFSFSYHMFLVTCEALPQVLLSETEHQGHIWLSPMESLGLDLIEDQDECTRLFFNL